MTDPLDTQRRLDAIEREMHRLRVASFGGSVALPVFEGFLATSLGVAEYDAGNFTTATATMTIWARNGDGNIANATKTCVLVNRFDTGLQANTGSYVVAVSVNGEYRPVYLSCSQIV